VTCPRGFAFSDTPTLLPFLLAVFSLYNFVANPISLQAQKHPKPGQPYALIFGTVWGPNDRPVYGVTVKIRRSQDKKAKWELVSDHQGEFAQRLPAGKADYVVWADLKNFKAADGTILHSGQEVPVHVNDDERVDIGLHLTK
jgi:hypothetical protein